MAQKKYVSLSRLQTFLNILSSKFASLSHNHKISDITDYVVDVALSSTSANPVQNKVLDAEFEAISTAMKALESVVDDKANSNHTHTISDVTDLHEATIDTAGLLSASNKIQLDYGGIPIATTSGTGAAYTATISGMTTLTIGMTFMMIPHTVSTSTSPTLNVNSLGAKTIRRRISNATTSTAAGYNASWLSANKPIVVTYDGLFWIADIPKPSAADVSGTMGVSNGGTGKNTVTSGSFLIGNGTSAMTEMTPAEVLEHMGITATADELNYVDGVTSNVQTQLDTLNTKITNKVDDYIIRLYNGTGGNPKPVKFLTINYSNCDSNNGVMIKVGMVSGHGNGTSYKFLQDVIINVGYTGSISADNFKYYGAAVTDSGVERQYGDIFWIHDSTNKIVDFYVLMGQYADVKMMPYKRLNSSSGGTVTQYTSCTVYSSGDKVWANNSDIALKSDIVGGSLATPSSDGLMSATDKANLDRLVSSVTTVHSGAEEPLSTLGEDGDLYLITE